MPRGRALGHHLLNPLLSSTLKHIIQGLADEIHELGLKIGIYEDYGTHTCGGYPGSRVSGLGGLTRKISRLRILIFRCFQAEL